MNAANTRFMRLSIGGRPFSILGSDGGLIEAPVEATEVLVTPGERVELAVGPFAEGEVLELEALPYDRGRGEPRRERFATIRVGPTEASSAQVPAPPARDRAADRQRESSRRRTVSMKALMHGGHGQRDDDVRVGELQVWELVNETSQDHPFHLHGFFFQVRRRRSATRLERHGQRRRRRRPSDIAWLPDDRPGEWMYHCHILEHHAMGMMAHFSVVA